MVPRSLYSTETRYEYRRYQIPREQKRNKWLQQYLKKVLQSSFYNPYLRARRWHIIRTHTGRLFRSLYHLRNQRAARRHFKKLHHRTPT
jgi:hypothetical protein